MRVPAWTRIHGCGQHESRGKSYRYGCAGNGHRAVFEGLAHDFQNIALKFREFIEKENAIVAERTLARARDGATADQTGVADGVVRRAIGAGADEAAAVFEDAGDAVNTSCFDGFVEGHRGKNGGDAFGEDGFAGAGRADE